MHQHHHHHHPTHGRALFWSILINVILTVVQIVGGILSGSLALLADAFHNFSDAGALIIAYVAQRISGRPANATMTYGYGRAQILGALINSTTLVIAGLYLIVESWQRFLTPQSIDAWTVIIVASVALVIDLLTAALTHRGSKESVNMRAVFIHNLSDALASLVVIISGILILIFDIYRVDLAATLLIALYILYQSFGLIRSCVQTLMQAVPEDINTSEVVEALKKITGVEDIHHVHIWAIHEKLRTFEAHVVVNKRDFDHFEKIKSQIRKVLKDRFKINHSTLEIESTEEDCETC